MRAIDPSGPLSQFGCVSSDRRVGPWEQVGRSWRRKGPEGYRNMINDEVASVSLGGFTAYGPDGLLEESGHVWGKPHDEQATLAQLRAEMDATLRSFEWVLC